jgi:hypothetical protein
MLQPEDNAATKDYNSHRNRFPTADEFEEIPTRYERKWVIRNNIKGYILSRNGASIFLQATNDNNNFPSLRYWSRSLNTKNCNEAMILQAQHLLVLKS